MSRLHALFAIVALTWSLTGCSSSTRAPGDAGSGAGGGRDGGATVAGDGGSPPIGQVTGTVLSPEGTIPIAGALVYLSNSKPDAIPDGVYCDKCVRVIEGSSYTTSGPDGKFVLPLYAEGQAYLVVQKGQFRRYRLQPFHAGDNTFDKSFTTLPAKMDKAAGDDVPRMAVVAGGFDKIEISLAKLGLGKLQNNLFLPVDPMSAAFDMYGVGPDPLHPPLDPQKLLTDWATLSKYHIVFIPCAGSGSSSSGGPSCGDPRTVDATVQGNLRKFVEAGGKLYVTDWSYDYVRQVFPGYVDWVGQTQQVGSACMQGAYDAPAMVQDQGMGDWLAAQGHASFSLEQSWTMIDKVNPVMATDVNMNPVTVTPKVWMSGQTSQGTRPMTVSFERQCGRVLFSTYHTEGGGEQGLLPQEKALLYVLLEVSVCVTPPDVL